MLAIPQCPFHPNSSFGPCIVIEFPKNKILILYDESQDEINIIKTNNTIFIPFNTKSALQKPT